MSSTAATHRPVQAALPAGSSLPAGAGPAGSVSLDLHEGIALTSRSRCDRWPKHLRLASTGALVPGRCRATNKCRYCQALYIIETVEALALDALGGSAPTVYAVLTCREHLTRPEFNEHLRMVRQALRRQGWRWEYFAQVEFQRRGALHVNLLVKGVPRDRVAEFRVALLAEWGARVSIDHAAQYCDAVADALAVAKYTSKMLAHGLKREQAPPLGWRGHRTSHSRGYFSRPMWRERADARASLQRKRELWKAEQAGADPEQAEAIASAAIEKAGRRRWELVVVSVDENGELARVRPASGGGVREVMRSPRASDHLRVADALWELAKLDRRKPLPLSGRDPVPTTSPLFTLPRRE